jgi:hypothetical protein
LIIIHYRRVKNAERKHVKERVQKRLSGWKGKLLFLGGRLVLLNLVLSNMVLHMIYFFQLHTCVLQILNYFLIKIVLVRR